MEKRNPASEWLVHPTWSESMPFVRGSSPVPESAMTGPGYTLAPLVVPGAFLGAGLLAAIITSALKKSSSGRARSDTSGKRRGPIVSRKPISKFAPARRAYKKGGVVKKKMARKN